MLFRSGIDFNTQLQQVCAQYIHCRFDNNAAFNIAFMPSDVSTVDYFHPSLAGQTLAASVSYGATFDFTDSVAPVSSASTAPAAGGINATLSATDNVGVSGIEYKIASGAWVRYATPVFVPTGSTLTYRAVDVNGNIEATHSMTAGSFLGGIDEAPDVSALQPATVRLIDARDVIVLASLAALAFVTLGAWYAARHRR